MTEGRKTRGKQAVKKKRHPSFLGTMFDGKPVPGNPFHKAWREAVAEIADKAKTTFPECNSRVDSAVKIVLNGDIELQAAGTAKIAS